jgi:hypothetical protein
MDDKIQSSKIKNYSLTIDSDQYVTKESWFSYCGW